MANGLLILTLLLAAIAAILAGMGVFSNARPPDARLNQILAEQQEAHGLLEREKQAVHGQLSEHRDRLQNLDGLLQDIQDKLRRGSDLAKG